MPRILAADIGGTNSRFALFEDSEREGLRLTARTWFKTADADSFGHLLDLLEQSGFPCRRDQADVAVIAFAGPVEHGVRSCPPNISWGIDLSPSAGLGLTRARLINDFVAQAFACRSPAVDSARLVLSGQPADDAPLAVIGAGTGLGKCLLAPDGRGGRLALPSEGGHTHFPFVGQEEFEYQRFLLEQTGKPLVIHDVVLSGSGLQLLHQFLTGEKLTPPEAAARCVQGSQTAAWFARFLGRACRNYALETLSLGGVYVSGGVAAKNPLLVLHAEFEREFRASETHAALLGRIPVALNANEDSGLWGAAVYGHQLLAE